METGKIKLTVNELVSGLALCGFDHVASQILNDHQLIRDDSEFERFIAQTETSLKEKGYWDEERETKLAEGLEDLLQLLVNTTKKIRCVHMNNRSVLLIHGLSKESSLIQEITGMEHTFSFHENSIGFHSVLGAFYRLKMTNRSLEDIQTIQMTDEMFDELHHEDEDVLNAMVEDESVDLSLRIFLKDFLYNRIEMDNISFMVSDYVEDQSKFDQIVFLLPGDDMVWHLDYENVANHELFITPVSVKEYFQKIESTLLEFL